MSRSGGPAGGASDVRVAYFSMEIAIASNIPTYAGGLGVLAGDAMRAAADLGLPAVAVTLVHRRGYFRQHLDAAGNQTEEPESWSPELELAPLAPIVEVALGGRRVKLRAWSRGLSGVRGGHLAIYFLDADLPDNHAEDRSLTDTLYDAEPRRRLAQEALLGIGGVRLLRAMGHSRIEVWHLNEGHSALLALALAEEFAAATPSATAAEVRDAVRAQCVFTTHTPVPAGHDQFPMALVRSVLGESRATRIEASGCCRGDSLNMTFLALRHAHFVNGVAMRHRQVSSDLAPGYPIDSITNGVHAATWVAPPWQRLFDREVPEWRRQNLNLRYAIGIALPDIVAAHADCKEALLRSVRDRTGRVLSANALTIGCARRATPYKRADLVFRDLDGLRAMARDVGPLQLLFAGKAHPRDEGGKQVIRNVYAAARALGDAVPVLYLENYDMDLARLLCAGADLWLNTPQKPQEASGTSGMKAALNGVPSLSVLDGWWLEGHVEGVTGWSVDQDWHAAPDDAAEANVIYRKLRDTILPLFRDRLAYAQRMRSCIALNGSFFNAERMMFQYAENAYGK